MILKIDTDFLLPITVAFLAITLTIAHQTLVPKSDIDYYLSENDILFSELSQSNHENTILTKELQSYRITIQELESLGASHTQAIQIIKASEVYSLDPKH